MELTFMGIAQNKLSKGSTPIFSCMLCDSTPRSVSPSVGWAVGWLVSWSPFWAAAPKGPVTYAFTNAGFFLLLLRTPSLPQISNPSLEAQFPASRVKSQSQSSNPSFKAQIPASRL